MTEDDTFKKLKQTPFETVDEYITFLTYKYFRTLTDISEQNKEVDDYLHSKGWTRLEYRNHPIVKARGIK